MAAPASEDIRELERLLVIAAENGETRSVASLQEELQIGHSDLSGALQALAEHGKAEELAPGEWTGPSGDAAAAHRPQAVPVVVSTPDPPEDDAATSSGEGFLLSPLTGHATVRLTRAITTALSDEALGQLVKAGLSDTSDDAAFVLEVI